MVNIIFYATKDDVQVIRDWINAEPEVAWIVKVNGVNRRYRWRAVFELEQIEEGEYSIWHVPSGPLNVPSGKLGVPDRIVANPFAGWSQTLASEGCTLPWFGANLPGPYCFRFRENGKEAAGSLGRSEFAWAANRFHAIGKPAHPQAVKWWNRLRRFLQVHSTKRPWVEGWPTPVAYVFPQALLEIDSGRPRDVNP